MSEDRASDSEPGPAPRPPRPLIAHALVDAGVAFLVTLLVVLLLGVPLGPVIAVSLVIGVIASPFTHRAEAHALAARAARWAPDDGAT